MIFAQANEFGISSKATKLQRKTERNILKKMWRLLVHTEPANGSVAYVGESAWTIIAYSHSRLSAMIQIKPFCLAIKFNVFLEMRMRMKAGQRVCETSAPLQPLTHAAATTAATTTCVCILYAWMNSPFEFACNSAQLNSIRSNTSLLSVLFCLFK